MKTHHIALTAALVLLSGTLEAGVNTWTGASPPGAPHQHPALVATAESEPSQVYAAYDSALYRSHDGGRVWSLVATFDSITALSVHPVTPSTIFVGGRRGGSHAGFFRSDDGGASWLQSRGPSQDVFVRTFAMSAKAPSRIYAIADKGLYRSDDGGGSWQSPPGNGNTLAGAVTDLLVDPRDGKRVWAGGYDDDFDYDYFATTTPFLRWSDDGAETWATATRGFPVGGKLQSIAIDPASLQTLYVGLDGETASVLRSRDSGNTWQVAQTGLPRRARVMSLAIDPRATGVVYAGTATGVFQTRNGGQSWVSISQQLSPAIVASLVMGGRILHAGTSRGVFELEVGEGAVDVAGEAGQTRLLDWKEQRLSIRTSPQSATPSLTPEEGPFPGWAAAAISDGPDGRSRVLWVSGDGRASLEIAGPSGAEASFQYDAIEHSAAIDVAASGDGGASLLWTSDTGAAFIATADATGAATLGPRYGPYPGWSAVSIAEGADGFTWALWRGIDGSVGVSLHRARVLWAAYVFVSAPNAGWAAEDITVGADGRPRVLRVRPDGRASVSTLDAQGLLSGEQISSNEGFRARRISAGPDGSIFLLWTSAEGDDDVWTLNADNTR